MDIVTLTLAKKYTDEKAGYTEKPVLTFNGDFTGKPLADGKFVKISDTPMDLNGLQKVIATVHPDFVDVIGVTTMEITKEQFTIQEADNGQYAIMNDNVFVFSVTEAGGDFSVGIYVLAEVADGTPAMWISRIEFAETIHPIDPKFIPGAVLPVVEFENADGTMSENDQANLTAAIGNPIVLKFPGANGIGIASLAAYDCSAGYHQFVCLYPQMIFRSTDGTTWEVIA